MSSTSRTPRGSAEESLREGRDKTDDSLRAERVSVDRVLAEKGRQDRASDSLTEQSRATADLKLELAREHVDLQIDGAATTVETADAVGAERAIDDERVKRERQQADRRLQRERSIFAASLIAMIPDERGETDRLLILERARSDEGIANRDDFLGIVSHDLRNLLGLISLNASALAHGLSGANQNEQTVLCAQRIQRASTQMNRLTADLLDVVSIDAGKLALRVAPGDVSGLLAELVDIFDQAARSKGITLELQNGPLPAAWAFDGGRVHQVLTNLLSNALKFTPVGGRVCLRCEADADQLRFSVSDTGKGITADLRESVFKRFWQVGQNEQRGLGLGLYISRCLVEAHGGAIWVESVAGAGSTFHFTLPAVPQALA